MHIVSKGTATAAAAILNSNAILDDKLAQYGYSQNKNTEEIVGGLRTRKEHRSLAAHMPGRVLRAMQYTGGHFHHGGSSAIEIDRRVQNMKKAWAIMGKFWHRRAPWRLKRSISINRIVGAAASGMESYLIKDTELRRLDTTIVNYLR
eukprot:872841-Pyramimonas_sp.AAC.1